MGRIPKPKDENNYVSVSIERYHQMFRAEHWCNRYREAIDRQDDNTLKWIARLTSTRELDRMETEGTDDSHSNLQS